MTAVCWCGHKRSKITLKDELDTPSLLIDLDKLARNIADMADFAAKTGVRLRPHTKTHKTPEIAKMQLEADATGLTVAKLSEAEIFTDAGCTDLLIAYPLVGPIKQRRLFELLNRAQVTTVLDHPDIAAKLSRAAVEYGRELPVLVDVDTDTDPDRRAIGERLDLRVLDPLTDDVIAATQAATAGLGMDAAVDAVGLTVTRRQCIDAVARGGVIFVGLHEADSEIQGNDVIRKKEVLINGVLPHWH